MINYFNVYMHIKGIAPRCRKSDRHIVDVSSRFPINYLPEDLDGLKNKAMGIISRYKGVSSASLKLSYTTFDPERQSNGFIVETTELFDTRHKEINLM